MRKLLALRPVVQPAFPKSETGPHLRPLLEKLDSFSIRGASPDGIVAFCGELGLGYRNGRAKHVLGEYQSAHRELKPFRAIWDVDISVYDNFVRYAMSSGKTETFCQVVIDQSWYAPKNLSLSYAREMYGHMVSGGLFAKDKMVGPILEVRKDTTAVLHFYVDGTSLFRSGYEKVCRSFDGGALWPPKAKPKPAPPSKAPKPPKPARGPHSPN